jgi:hypothetical protein
MIRYQRKNMYVIKKKKIEGMKGRLHEREDLHHYSVSVFSEKETTL